MGSVVWEWKGLVYRLLKEYRNRRVLGILFVKLMYYGVLVMVVCDSEGVVYDL
jgi:hypothetical protein